MFFLSRNTIIRASISEGNGSLIRIELKGERAVFIVRSLRK